MHRAPPHSPPFPSTPLSHPAGAAQRPFHARLPRSADGAAAVLPPAPPRQEGQAPAADEQQGQPQPAAGGAVPVGPRRPLDGRSEEHTSELQSPISRMPSSA